MGAEFQGKARPIEEFSHIPSLFTDLERDIDELKKFAGPLQEEVIVSPLMKVIESIMSLPSDLKGKDNEKIHEIEEQVKEYRRELDEISYRYISEIITKPEQSNVFKILANSNVFKGVLQRAIGKEMELSTGEKVTITPKLVEALTRFKFSIGTPPITPKGIETIERILFGGDLKNIYQFRDLLKIDRVKFDRFITNVARLVEDSTHYTTASEKSEFEKEATDFSNMEGLRGLTKTVISGTSNTAIRLISDQLFSRYKDKSLPLEIVEGQNKLDDDLIERMTTQKEAIFVVRISQVPHHIFTDDKLKDKWHGVMGRLVLIDDSDNAHRSDTTLVYSINSEITGTLAKLHVKDSGTPANTQMNLRRILENFSNDDLGQFKKEVDAKIEALEEEGIDKLPASEVRKKVWLITSQKDYFSLKKFQSFLEFILYLKNATPEELEKKNAELRAKVSSQTMDYFFKALKGKGYDCLSIPQGGGRREIGLIGNLKHEKTTKLLDDFRANGLEASRKKLLELKAKKKLPTTTTYAEEKALQRAQYQSESPVSAIQGEVGTNFRITQRLKERIHGLFQEGVTGSESARIRLEDGLKIVTNANLSGALRVSVGKKLTNGNIVFDDKPVERGSFRNIANSVRNKQGALQRAGNTFFEPMERMTEAVKRRLEKRSLDFAEQMLNEIEEGKFQSSLALAELGWTYDDVLNPDFFPTKNYIKIAVDENGQMDADSLEKQIKAVKEELHHFPELFEIYCKSIILIINDPHNPTSKIMSYETKVNLLDMASKYGITILSDEAYRKQVDNGIKKEQGDVSLSEFKGQHPGRFDQLTIDTSFPTTKWAMGAGRRTGVIVTNDPELKASVEENIDGVHSMSLFMDSETMRMGEVVKTICKAFELFVVAENIPMLDFLSIKAMTKKMDKLLEDESLRPMYFKLIEARNDLDRLRVRGASGPEHGMYIKNFISEIKDFRLDKQTQRDSAKRAKAVKVAIDEVEKDYPGIAERTIYPEGPFYVLVKLDNNGKDPALQPFLETIARARNISVVAQSNGYVRFAFGGMLDGTDGGYKLLSKAISTDLSLLIKYWEKFKTTKAELNKNGDLNPVRTALLELFPGGVVGLMQSIEDKKPLLDELERYKGPKRKKIAYDIPAYAAQYIAKIEPSSATRVITINDVKCKSTQALVDGKPFRDLFNTFLLEVKNEIPALQHLSDKDIHAYYGARQFAKKFRSRMFANNEKAIFSQIIVAVANKWFSQDTVKILAEHNKEGRNIMGAEAEVTSYIKQLIRAIATDEGIKEITYRASFQAGYSAIDNLKASENLPSWGQSIINNFEFAGVTCPTDRSTEIKTCAKTRVPGFDRGIFRRDGGKGPTAKYFSDRLKNFTKTANKEDYVCKMVQVGGSRVMLVMNRAYSHYIVEELRLYPQIELLDEDATNMRPDAVSFLGIPAKVMSEDYRIGYFMDECEDGEKLPVSWVDKEDITDYMGYLKKPILTVANEKVNEKEGLAIHGSAVTIVFKNGLRKTVVFAGDSGTGKSETIIAMVEQLINAYGTAKDVESIELLAGDMLSLYKGDDKQVYMFGTETGDFMRMTDIPEDWKNRFSDLIEMGSKTNLDDPKNPRITISGLCKEENVLSPTRINFFININNFSLPPEGISFIETEVQKNLLFGDYVEGKRGEKGTSGDQPNIYASVKHSNQADKDEILSRYGESLDDLISWDIIMDDIGKAENAIMSFKEVDGKVFISKRMVNDLFLGKKLKYKKNECKIIATRHDVHKNQYFVTLESEDGASEEIPLYRNEVFNKIYNPVASTYGGNPFMDPERVRINLQNMAEAMKEAGVITGTLYTQLKIDSKNGPAAAAQSLLKFIIGDTRISGRFKENLAKVSTALLNEYGQGILGQSDIPVQISSHNLYKLERFESDTIRLIDSNKETIDIKTPYYRYNPDAKGNEFKPSLITPDMQKAIQEVCENEEYGNINLEMYKPDTSVYINKIKNWHSKEELIYQILLINGVFKLGYTSEIAERHAVEVKKAEKAAEIIIGVKSVIDKLSSNEKSGDLDVEISRPEIEEYMGKIDTKGSKNYLIFQILHKDGGIDKCAYAEESAEAEPETAESDPESAEAVAKKAEAAAKKAREVEKIKRAEKIAILIMEEVEKAKKAA